MDPSRDNPLIRFTTFWWGIGTFFIFAALLAVIWLFARPEPASLEDVAAQPRYATKAKIDAAQSANLSPESIEAAAATVAKRLADSKPKSFLGRIPQRNSQRLLPWTPRRSIQLLRVLTHRSIQR